MGKRPNKAGLSTKGVLRLNPLQGLRQVRKDAVDMLDTDAEAYLPRGHALAEGSSGESCEWIMLAGWIARLRES